MTLGRTMANVRQWLNQQRGFASAVSTAVDPSLLLFEKLYASHFHFPLAAAALGPLLPLQKVVSNQPHNLHDTTILARLLDVINLPTSVAGTGTSRQFPHLRER
jgi:hypothetical protein